MKKYLLGLLVVGLSFFSFSSAYQFNTDKSTVLNGVAPNDYISIGTLNKYSESQVCIQSTFSNCISQPNLQIKCSGGSCRKSLNLTNGGKVCLSVSDVFYKNFNSTDVKFYGGRNNCQYNVKFSQSVVVEGLTPDGPVSTLSPAINGLRGTVYQIIPFVVYIGIGVLLAIIGFSAICWLVNWMGGKINSYFRSKRN